jgi:hypothetical protein
MENTVHKREKGKRETKQLHLLGDQRRLTKDKFKFPGGGTKFIQGADPYLDHISKVIRHFGLTF